VYIAEKVLVQTGGIAVDERRHADEGNRPVGMLRVQPPKNIRLDDGEPLTGPVLQVLLDLRAVQALKQQPGGVAQVEEGFAVLILQVASVRADVELGVFHVRCSLMALNRAAWRGRRRIPSPEQPGEKSARREDDPTSRVEYPDLEAEVD